MGVARGVRHFGSDASQKHRMSARRGKVPMALIDPLALRRASLQSMLTTACPDFAMSVFADVAGLISETGAKAQAELVLLHLGTDRIADEAHRVTFDTLAAELGPVPVVLLADRAGFEEMVAAVHLGARGVLPTTMEPAEAIQALWLVHAGGIFLPAKVVVDYFDGQPSTGHPDHWVKHEGKMCELTQRERQVLTLIQEGMPNKIIAHKLKLCQGTIKVYVRRLMRKLGVSNRTQAALVAHSLAGQMAEKGDSRKS
jgi:two-component system, NarL family, nitrate/nitrite response regulator NarL